MQVKVGFTNIPNVTAEFTLLQDDADVKNMHAGNWQSVALAIIRRRLQCPVFPVSVSKPEWALKDKQGKAA